MFVYEGQSSQPGTRMQLDPGSLVLASFAQSLQFLATTSLAWLLVVGFPPHFLT